MTTKQRREIYLKAIQFIGKFGCCRAIREADRGRYDVYFHLWREESYPEFVLFEPPDNKFTYWDWDNKARIICLFTLC